MSFQASAPPFIPGLPAGVIVGYAGSPAPSGWLECMGQAVSRTTFSDLFAALGTTYGPGDGATTFNLPDGRGRMFIGEGTGPGLTSRSRGNTGGTEALSGLRVVAAGADYNVVSEIPNGTPWPSMNPFGVAKWIVKT